MTILETILSLISVVIALILALSHWLFGFDLLEITMEKMLVVLTILVFFSRILTPYKSKKQPYKEIHHVKDGKETLQHYYGNEDVAVVAERILLDDRVILFVPFKERVYVEAMGAMWDKKLEKHYIPAIWDITAFAPWILPESFLHEKINTEGAK